MDTTFAPLLGIAVCVAVSAVLSGMESGVLALNPLRIRQLVRAGNPRARVLHRFLEDPENFLWTILVGNTLTNFLAVCLAVALAYRHLSSRPVLFLLAFVAGVFLFYVFCELFPKVLFRQFPNRLCLLLARPFRSLHAALSPLVWVVSRISRGLLHWTGGRMFEGRWFGTRDELRILMHDATQGLTVEERQMINRVLDLNQLTVGRIATPLQRTTCVDRGTPLKQGLEICRDQRLTRLPVTEGEGDTRRIGGLLSLKDVLYRSDVDESLPVSGFMKPVFSLWQEMRIEEALRQLRRSGERLAVVLAPDGRQTGIVSLEDLLTVIFGEVSL
ncbi:MAG TPA: hemolysin family protein [Methylomirabilota bacterium]|nr:hemolysin family protein [Methylomirabilota bacterium]